MRKVVVASDSFKGCLTSLEVAYAVEEGIKAVFPSCEVLKFPLADGGEGTMRLLTTALNGKIVCANVHDPLMRPIQAAYGVIHDSQTAIIELASASGLPLLKKRERNPSRTTTFGTGELIAHALKTGCRHFVLGIGGSATNDAGIGLLSALGYRFLDWSGQEIPLNGAGLMQLETIDDSHPMPGLKEATFEIACDVNNPLYGPQGAAFIYARQKGADKRMIHQLDIGLRRFATLVEKQYGHKISNLPGAGAAGGTSAALAGFLGARLVSGSQLVLQALRFKEILYGADMIITGEGRLDKQTLMGKAPGAVLTLAKERGIKVIAIAGKVNSAAGLIKAGFDGCFAISPDTLPLREAMLPETAKANIKCLIKQIFTNHL